MKVFIAEGGFQYRRMFEERGWEVVDRVSEAQLVQFCGGADVDPHLYGEVCHKTTQVDFRRDVSDTKTYKEAKELKIPMAGICRGAQFLHVMCGGSLWQHVDGHALMPGHLAVDHLTGETISVTSTHHQMMREGVGELLMEAEGTSNTFKEAANYQLLKRRESKLKYGKEVEAVLHREHNVLCYQPHPEMCKKASACQNTYFNYLEVLIHGKV